MTWSAKTIKQNLKIKSFLGTSQNAVMTQIWICMITCLLLKYIAKEANRNWTVQSLMAIISTLLFVKQDIWIWLNKSKLIDDFSEKNTVQLGLAY
ncbi:hypothetical protein [Spirochaeta cellobiosiphila]|uniref:hypothetical protein n=1 Tax=Spirochaeta cellobiosiphila TaxID=504483 RepID=UPI00048C0498|nr:hypothetical protein [Spirochaeta cellobiosiphila]